MKKLCLCAALILSIASGGCAKKVKARMELKQANDLYGKEQYADALKHYEKARAVDPSFPDVDRLIGYSNIGLFKPDDPSPANAQYADRGIQELTTYLQKRPDDVTAREALVNLFLNANRISQAIEYFKEYLSRHPADLAAVRSIATLYAKQGDFNESLNWYEKITLIDAKNPESHYIYGVVLYEKVSKNPPADPLEKIALIERGKAALQKAVDLNKDYFEAIVYLNLLYRQQALVETDPVRQQELIQTADGLRARAMELGKKRKK